MRYASWLLSILLHVTVLILLLQTVQLEPFDLKDLMELDLTEMEVPEDVIQPMPVPMPPPPEPIPESPIPADAKIAPMPLPMDKTVVLDDSPPPPPVAAEALAPEPEPVAEPEFVEISPVKTEKKKLPRRIDVRKGDTVVHRGHEARFGRSMMADYYSYEASEFSGNFKARDDRTISIIDARNTKYGRFLIYDSKNKTLRRLKEFAKYIYTIGPSVYADEPIIGTVTFLAKNDRIERFILQTDDDRIAHYPRKVHVQEKDVQFPTQNGELHGQTTLPPFGEGHPGIVFVHGAQCVDPGLIRGFTRALSMRELASLAFQPRGCESEESAPSPNNDIVTDTAAALDYFSGLKQMKGGLTGLWGNGPGTPIVIRAALNHGTTKPAYLVCLLDDTLSPDDMVKKATLSQLDIPTLWLITGRDTTKWKPLIRTLEALRDTNKRPFTIVLAPLKASKEVLDAKSEQSGWVEQVTEDHSRLAVSWIQRLDN